MLFGSLLVDGCTRKTSLTATDVLSLPDKVLNQVALVLGEKQQLCLFDDIANVGHECTTLFREPSGR